MRATAVGLLAALVLAPAGARAQSDEAEPPVSISLETTAVSSFLWRGLVLNDSPSLQPGITIGWRGFSVASWQNFSRRAPNGQVWTENDLVLGYAREIGRFTASAGYSRYHYPDTAPVDGNVSHEFYAGVSHENWLNPSLTFYTDVKLAKGNYWFASVGHPFELSPRLLLNTGLGVGLNQHQYQPATTISNVDGTVSLDIRISRRFTLSPGFIQMVGHRSLFGRHRAFSLEMSLTH